MPLCKIGPNLFVRQRSPLQDIELVEPIEIQTHPYSFYTKMDGYGPRRNQLVQLNGGMKFHVGRVPVMSATQKSFGSEPFQAPSHAVVRIRKVMPESHWDHTNGIFSPPRTSAELFALSSLFA